MKGKMYSVISMSILALLLAGCATTVSTQNPQPEQRDEVFAFTPEDVDKAVEIWMEDLMKFGPVAESSTPPLIGFCGMANKSMDHDTDLPLDEFQRSFEYYGLRTNRIRLTNAMTLPDKFFEQHKLQKSMVCDRDTSVKIGKILGWKYSVYGELFETKEKDAKGNSIKYYTAHVYMLNIETAEQVWNSRHKFKLYADRPLIGK